MCMCIIIICTPGLSYTGGPHSFVQDQCEYCEMRQSDEEDASVAAVAEGPIEEEDEKLCPGRMGMMTR